MVRIVTRDFSSLNKKAELAFVKANARFEGERLSFTDMKNSAYLFSHRQTADQLVEKAILQNRLSRTV